MSRGLPDNLISLLGEADKRNGFPSGTMYSVLQQESGGQDRFINDPSTYHYPLNENGQRIAGHTGKVSTAFGPFGILESTGAKPGYGVAPLKDKSIEEQVRFAGDYLAARSKQAGSLQAGLGGYGEGSPYANKVMSHLGNAPVAPTQVATNQAAAPQVQAAPVQVAQAQKPINESDLIDPNMAWNGLDTGVQETIPAASVNFGSKYAVQTPMIQPNFAAFNGWGKRRA